MKTKFIFAIILIIVLGGLFLVKISLFKDNWDLKSCDDECIHRGYEIGECIWPMEAEEGNINIGGCLIPQSRHCGNKEQCDCYCKNQSTTNACEQNSDCVVFGETGDCNCGCYNKNALPRIPEENVFVWLLYHVNV